MRWIGTQGGVEAIDTPQDLRLKNQSSFFSPDFMRGTFQIISTVDEIFPMTHQQYSSDGFIRQTDKGAGPEMPAASRCNKSAGHYGTPLVFESQSAR